MIFNSKIDKYAVLPIREHFLFINIANYIIYTHIYIYIYIYIYTYIYCHPQKDCFVVSRLFSVVRYVWCLKLESKPTQLYSGHSIILFSQQTSHISSGTRHNAVAFVCLHFCVRDTWMLKSFKELCIMLVAAVNSFARVLNIVGER